MAQSDEPRKACRSQNRPIRFGLDLKRKNSLDLQGKSLCSTVAKMCQVAVESKQPDSSHRIGRDAVGARNLWTRELLFNLEVPDASPLW